MSRLPTLEQALRDAAQRAHDGVPAPAAPTPAPRRFWRTPLGVLVVLAGLGGTGAAVAATGLLERGEPVPRSVRPFAGGLASISPGSTRVMKVRAADPDGGPPWGLRIFRTRDGLACEQFGRVQRGELGVVGRDGAFRDDGRFHPNPADRQQSGSCGGLLDGGQLYSSGLQSGIPASGYSGRPGGAVGGCVERVDPATQSPQTRRRLRGLPVCGRGTARTLIYGFGGAEAVKVELLGSDRRAVVPGRDDSGAYLFVLRSMERWSSVRVTYRGGLECTVTARTDRPVPDGDCFPPPGIRMPSPASGGPLPRPGD
ncbi:hypothetical protein [Patulibacter minatonensis]|uniref:hypothetical protein n=1 Tax=Patulibacter minatonensis TaxID=298163 RepID=UPI00047E61DB|nr:hypothetical protein [Patulibacter minatonensis]